MTYILFVVIYIFTRLFIRNLSMTKYVCIIYVHTSISHAPPILIIAMVLLLSDLFSTTCFTPSGSQTCSAQRTYPHKYITHCQFSQNVIIQQFHHIELDMRVHVAIRPRDCRRSKYMILSVNHPLFASRTSRYRRQIYSTHAHMHGNVDCSSSVLIGMLLNSTLMLTRSQ